jgi:hypothetical protein
MVTVAFLALAALTGIAIDSAVMWTTKTQLQNAADASALAGASGLIEGSEDLAVSRAIEIAAANRAVQDAGGAPVVITPEDVEFPEPDMIRVTAHRTRASGDPLRLFFRRIVEPASDNLADVTAVAAARAYSVCGARCVRPWAIPDRWDDANDNGEYDEGEYYHPEGTGYVADLDVGAQITLKVGNPQQAIEPGIFYPINFPPLDSDMGNPLTGGDWYREWISECAPFLVQIGDRLQLEPGNMVGPTRQGMDALIAQDPSAYWDSTFETVSGSAYALSPRIGLVPLFDPTLPPESGRNWVTVTKIGAFFIEETGPGGEVTGRFIDTITAGSECEEGSGGGFVMGITLTE